MGRVARTPTRMLNPVVLAAVLAALAIWAYAPSFKGVFIYDDRVAIVENPNIRSLWPLSSALSAPAESPVSARPTAALSLAINYALAPRDVREVMAPASPGDPAGTTARFLRNVWGYHAMNLLLHLLAALAIAGAVHRTLLTDRLRDRFGESATLLAFAAAAIWAVHPLTTDAVTYVAQRTEVLMGLCFATTLYCAIRASGRGADPRAIRRWTIGAVVVCALGMGSKQTMVTAPIVVWIWDWIFLEAAGDRGSRRWLYAGLSATWVLLGALVAYERWPTSIGFALEGWTPWTYLLTQTTVIAHYTRLAVFGGPLALDYDGWPMARSAIAVLPYALPLVLLFAATTIGVLRRRAWAFPFVVWFAALAPSSSVLPLATEIAAERRMYIPLAAMVVLAVTGAIVVGRRALNTVAADEHSRRVAGTAAGGLALVAVLVIYGSMTFARNGDFANEETLWGDTVEKRPANSRARLNYGVKLAEDGRLHEAERQLREAVRLKDTSAPAHLNLGSVLSKLGRLKEGVAHLERALALDTTYTVAYHNLGEAYGALGNRLLATKYFALAVEVKPDEPFLLNRLGWLLSTSPEDHVRDGARAVSVAERAVQLTARQDPTSLDTLAAAYAEVGRFTEAVIVIREAIALAERQRQQALTRELLERRALYEAGKRFREGTRVPGSPDL